VKNSKTKLAPLVAALTLACGQEPLGAPRDVEVAPGPLAGSALVTFRGPSAGTARGYSVTVTPGDLEVTGPSSPLALTGLPVRTALTFELVAQGDGGDSERVTVGPVRFYDVVATFHEPRTQPNDTVFTGAFTRDVGSGAITGLAGSLTQSMSGSPPTEVRLEHQLSTALVTLDGTAGALVTTFALPTTDTFDPAGFAPGGGTQYYGLSAGAKNPAAGGVGNAYAMIFVPGADPTTPLTEAQLDHIAYADCTAGGMMMTTCMTGTSAAGYGRDGTMGGRPDSQNVTER
jgi:hypothetical protein